MSNAYDNPHKQCVRDKITKKINDHFCNKDISMIELLGSGVGAEYYLKNINNLSEIVLLERDVASFCLFYSKLTEFRNIFKDKKIALQNTNIKSYLLHCQIFNKYFDVINFDFCGLFKPFTAVKTRNNVLPVIDAFERKIIEDNGLVFATYKIGGWYPGGWDDSIITNPDTISSILKASASKNYDLTEIHRYIYKSQEGKRGQASDMLSIGFKCIKKKENVM